MKLVVSRWTIAALRSRLRKGVEANKALLAKMWQYRTKAMKYDAWRRAERRCTLVAKKKAVRLIKKSKV